MPIKIDSRFPPLSPAKAKQARLVQNTAGLEAKLPPSPHAQWFEEAKQ